MSAFALTEKKSTEYLEKWTWKETKVGDVLLFSSRGCQEKGDCRGSGYKDLEERRLEEKEVVQLYGPEGVGDGEATGSVSGERSQEEGEEEVVA